MQLEKREYLLGIMLVIGLLIAGGIRSGQLTGFIVSDQPSEPQVQVVIDYGNRTSADYADLERTDSALDLLTKIAVVEYVTEGEEGAKVTGINGVKNDEKEWVFLVNGLEPDLSVSHYHASVDDVIEFEYR